MLNERPDEFLSWRGRLAAPDALPDQGLDDKEVSWERLAERLREKPRRRIGYWIAAACLLLALIPATHFFRDRPARLAGHHPVPHPSALPLSSPRQTVPDQTASRRRPAATHFTAPASGSRLTPALLPVRLADPIPTTTDVSVAAPPAAMSPVAAPPSPKKQWRIVYLNEIDKGGGPAPSLMTRDPGFLHIGTASTGIGDWASGQNSPPGLKIELSSPTH